MREILDRRTKVVDDNLELFIHDGGGHRMIKRGSAFICNEALEEFGRCAKLLLDLRLPPRSSIAIIGGGFCIMPRLLQGRGLTITVFEIEPALARFCPDNCTFIPGDYHETLQGRYDGIIYDLPIALDTDLTPYLNPGGIILGIPT
jgi:hypothetical protein